MALFLWLLQLNRPLELKVAELNKINQVPIEHAPSLILLAFAGVTVPSFIKADFKVGNFSGANF